MTTDAISGVYSSFMSKNEDNVRYYGTSGYGRMTPAEREQQRTDAAIARATGTHQINLTRYQTGNGNRREMRDLKAAVEKVYNHIEASNDNQAMNAFKELVEIIEKSEREAERVGDEVTYLTGQSAKNRAMELYKSITGKSFVEHVREKCDGDLFTGIFALGIGESASSLEDYATGDSKTVGDHVAEKTGAVATGAAIGAAVGSVVPVVGTAAGAVVGGVVGFIASWF